MKNNQIDSTIKTAYLCFGGSFVGFPNGPFLSTRVPAIETRWVPQNKTGYGRRIKTPYMVNWSNRWYRVYACQFSNAGTLYIESKGKPIATVDYLERG
jgi:hypothetical protein